jgi:hypothetical protein
MTKPLLDRGFLRTPVDINYYDGAVGERPRDTFLCPAAHWICFDAGHRRVSGPGDTDAKGE